MSLHSCITVDKPSRYSLGRCQNASLSPPLLFLLLLLDSVVSGHPGLCPFSFSLLHLPYLPRDAIHSDALSASLHVGDSLTTPWTPMSYSPLGISTWMSIGISNLIYPQMSFLFPSPCHPQSSSYSSLLNSIIANWVLTVVQSPDLLSLASHIRSIPKSGWLYIKTHPESAIATTLSHVDYSRLLITSPSSVLVTFILVLTQQLEWFG